MRDYNVAAEKTPLAKEEPKHVIIARDMASEIASQDIQVQTEMLQELVQNVYLRRKDMIERLNKEINSATDEIKRIETHNNVLTKIFS